MVSVNDNATRSFSIGQVIYVLSNKAQKIVPAIVVEEVVVKKLEGNSVSWKVSVGPAGKEKVIDSSRLDGDIYTNLEEIRDVLNRKLSSFLDELVGEAEKRALSWYGQQTRQTLSVPGESSEKIDPDSLLTDIETKPLIPMTSTPATRHLPPASILPRNPVGDELRRRMESMADPETSLGGGRVVDTEEVQLPDGQTVKVNIKV